jgi:DNA excision repair protein ERCC-4
MADKPRPVIIVDTREQRAWEFTNDVDVQIATLETGDYSVNGATDYVRIERKSLPDLVGCVAQSRERFEDELRRLESYAVRAVIVEASILDVEAHCYRSQVRPQSVIGSTVAWQTDRGIPFVWAGNARLAARIAEKILTRVWRKRSAEGERAA